MTIEFDKPRISFLGVPVYGDFNEPATRVDQRPIEELQPLLKAAIDHPDFAAVRWEQYTPYFDDGDPCVFSIRKPGFLLKEQEEDIDSFDTYDNSVDRHPLLGQCRYEWSDEKREYVRLPYEGPDEQRYQVFKDLSDAIEGGAFESVLLAAFGDHAEVTITPDRIDVDHYEHN